MTGAGRSGAPGRRLDGPAGEGLALVAGALLPLAFAPFGAWFVAPLSLVGLLAALEAQSPRRGAWRGWLFGVTAFLGGLYWVHISIHVFGGAALAFAIALMLALVLVMALYTAAFGYALNRFFPHGVARRALLAAPALWALLEWLRGWLFSGFPWLSLGYSQTDSALAALAPLVGVYGMSAAVAVTAGALWTLIAAPRVRRFALLPALALWAAAAGLARVEFTAPEGAPVEVALIQGAVPQEIKWLPESLQPTVDLYLTLTDAHLDKDLIVWPEAAIPTARHNLEALFASLADRGAQTGADFLVGAVEIERDTGRRLNTVVAIPGGATAGDMTRYVKRHLVPYGEYYPVPEFVREWLRWMDLPYQDFSPGPDGQPPLAVAGQQVGISICYEDVFGEELADALPQATLLVNVSNDAWFGGSVAPHQHLQIARLRAIESGRVLVRATNTGISAVIDADGAVLARSPQFEPHVLTHAAQPRRGATPYVRLTNWPVVIASLIALAAAWRGRRAAASRGVNHA